MLNGTERALVKMYLHAVWFPTPSVPTVPLAHTKAGALVVVC